MGTKPEDNATATKSESKTEPKPSEKYLLGERMVVEFLGKPYELGVRSDALEH